MYLKKLQYHKHNQLINITILGMNGGQNDPSNVVAAAVAHGGLLQPMSMQSLLAMASMGQQASLAAPNNQSISAASMNNVAAPLCKYIFK